MDVLMTQRRPVARSTRKATASPSAAGVSARSAAPVLPPPQSVHLWMVPASADKSPAIARDGNPAGGGSPTQAALAYRAAQTAVGTK